MAKPSGVVGDGGRTSGIFVHPSDRSGDVSRAGGAAEIPKVRPEPMGERQPAEILRPHRSRSDLVLVLRLDDRSIFAWSRDAAERGIVLVPDPFLRWQEM